MNIKETFLKLTSRTYPYGNEHRLRYMLPKDIMRDKHGNFYYQIGKSKTIFACHLDTVSKKYEEVTHVIEGNIIKTNGKTILGADDKAGMCVLLYMMEQKIPGTYFFYIGEEVGCIGSKAAASKDKKFYSDYDKIISFDRKDVCSIITHQSWERCCSDSFANALSKEFISLGLDLKPDDTGVGTDSAQFTDIIPECTNISVGYYKEHTHDESQDIDFLEKLCMACALIDWDKLPVKRNPKIKEYKSYTNNSSSHYNNWLEKNRAKKWNDKPKRKDIIDLRKTYGYDIDEETPIDSAFAEDLNKGICKIPLSKGDVYTLYKDYLSDKHFSIEDYNLIEEQYIENYLL
jgi:hypothetical protein